MGTGIWSLGEGKGNSAVTTLTWVGIALAGALSLAAPACVRPLLSRLGVLDVPNDRSSHTRPTIRGGGIAPAIGLTVGTLCVYLALAAADPDAARLVGLIGAASVAAALIGLVEDVKGLPTAVRAAGQLLVGAALSAALVTVSHLSWWLIPFGAVAFAAYVNFVNFMDGINAISSLHGLAAGLGYAVLGWTTGSDWLVAAGLLIAVCLVAFLPWNLVPPGMFLGDVGSYLLGGGLAAVALTSFAVGLHPLCAMAPLTIYLADTIATLLRRAVRKEPIFQAHRSHTYQRLTDTGLSHVAVALIVTASTVLTTASGLLLIYTGRPILTVSLLLLLALLYLSLPGLAERLQRPNPSQDLCPVSEPAPIPARPNWAPETWAVLGATGFIGSALADHLREVGCPVIAIPAPRVLLDPASDSGGEVAALAEGMPETDALTLALRGASVVVNAAGLATPDGPSSAELYGANALLPAVIAKAADRADVTRVIHLSSAAVQGHRQVLDDSADVEPFSAYSRSKALGEQAFLAAAAPDSTTDLLIVRATSVQGPSRGTTINLKRLARSPLASVAAPGDQPSVVSSVDGLVRFVHAVGVEQGAQRAIQLQPWEGLSAFQVLELAGGKKPKVLPVWFCRSAVAAARTVSALIPKLRGGVRRIEVMWFGQQQVTTTRRSAHSEHLRAVLGSSEVAQ